MNVAENLKNTKLALLLWSTVILYLSVIVGESQWRTPNLCMKLCDTSVQKYVQYACVLDFLLEADFNGVLSLNHASMHVVNFVLHYGL